MSREYSDMGSHQDPEDQKRKSPIQAQDSYSARSQNTINLAQEPGPNNQGHPNDSSNKFKSQSRRLDIPGDSDADRVSERTIQLSEKSVSINSMDQNTPGSIADDDKTKTDPEKSESKIQDTPIQNSRPQLATEENLLVNAAMSTRLNSYKRGECVSNKKFKKVFQCLQNNRGGMLTVKTYLLLPEVHTATKDQEIVVKEEITNLANTIIDLVKMASSGLDHKNILKYQDAAWSTDKLGCIDIISESISDSLEYLIKQYSPLEEGSVAMYLKQILEAVQYLHEHGVPPGNLKSSNVLADKDGVIKICDYICPEQCKALEEILLDEDRKFRQSE
jgi:hypothetical protein